jgi:hypothetical protein
MTVQAYHLSKETTFRIALPVKQIAYRIHDGA